jgi:RNA polymerase sigma-70 factor (ECF subfamily)
MDETQEREVARGLRCGSTEAWCALYDAYAHRVWQSVARRLGPRSGDVGDVVQETFLAAARSARGFDPQRGSLWNWLGGIARNQVALFYRRRRRDDCPASDVGLTEADAGQVLQWLDGGLPPADEVLASAELAATIRDILADLPADYGELLAAKYLDGETIQEIAGQREASTEAVRSRLARARRAFRKAFANSVPCYDASRARDGDE